MVLFVKRYYRSCSYLIFERVIVGMNNLKRVLDKWFWGYTEIEENFRVRVFFIKVWFVVSIVFFGVSFVINE